MGKNLSYIMLGQMCNPVAGLLTLPLILKFYAVNEIGEYFFAVSFCGVMVTLVAMGLDTALALEKNDRIASHLQALAILSGAIIASFLAPLLYTLQPWAFPDYFNPHVLLNLVFVSLAIFAVNAETVVVAMQMRNNSFRQFALHKLIATIVTFTAQLLLADNYLGINGLIVGFAIGHFCGALAGMLRINFRTGLGIIFSPPGLKESLHVLSMKRKFIFFTMPSASLARFGNEMPGLLVPLFLGPQYAGLFAVCSRVLASPASMIGATMAKFYLSSIAKLERAQKKEFFRKTFAFIVTVAICLSSYVGLLNLSKGLLGLWLGDIIHQVLPIVMITFPYVVAQVCYRTVSPAYDFLNIQRTRLMCVACACLVPGITFIVVASLGSSENTTLGVYSLVRAVGCVLLISIIFAELIPENRFNSFRNWFGVAKTKQLDNSI